MSSVKKSTTVMSTTTIVSKDNKFRYILEKKWNEKKKVALVISLSAGKAGEVFSDYTTTFIVNALNELDFGTAYIANIFPHVTEKYVTDLENIKHIKEYTMMEEIDSIIICWGRGCEGASKMVKAEIEKIEKVLQGVSEKCVVIADKKGLRGLHPLRAQNSWILVPWKKNDKKSDVPLEEVKS